MNTVEKIQEEIDKIVDNTGVRFTTNHGTVLFARVFVFPFSEDQYVLVALPFETGSSFDEPWSTLVFAPTSEGKGLHFESVNSFAGEIMMYPLQNVKQAIIDLGKKSKSSYADASQIAATQWNVSIDE